MFPHTRLRRLRKNSAIRGMLADPMPEPSKLVWPTFVVEGSGVKDEISSMPGQHRYSVDTLLGDVDRLLESGVRSVMLFGVVDGAHKSSDAAYALRDDAVVQRAVVELKRRFPELFVFTDICVCEYTSHGHCGIFSEEGEVLNDPTLELLSKMAVSHTSAGADAVAPSAMMDGQVAAIREALDGNGFQDALIMSYSTKFASSMYGPFRAAADSAPASGDRKSYQADFRNSAAALRESELDESEGADILMVKPALFYLDLISEIKRRSLLPLAAYNVSGEYSMLIASAERGWGDLTMMVRESIAAMARAGTDIIITYWANGYMEILKG
ncbi:MAG: porphobilinogen synthase [Kiritimatiellaeota bacterium]|nr:porphobilinogen synthase [Kiritimatiellota bacterium]